jgi:hypothetical protein
MTTPAKEERYFQLEMTAKETLAAVVQAHWKEIL